MRPSSRTSRESVAALAALASLLSAGVAASAADGSTPARADASCPQPFKITLDVEWRGMGAGTSTLQLVRKGTNEYTYSSSNIARGLFKIAIPDTITQISDFTIVDGKVRPGLMSGMTARPIPSKDVSLKFDWAAQAVTGTAEQKPVNATIQPGVQDSLSVQIALMCALAVGESPKSFQLIDKDEVKEYQYRHEGNATLDTPIGKLETVIYTSQRRRREPADAVVDRAEPRLSAGAG